MAKSFSEFANTIIIALEELKIPYAIGGSVASSAYGAYRTTNDIDISIQMPMEQAEAFINTMVGLGYYAYIDAILDAFIWKTPFNVIDSTSGLKVDFFLVAPTPLEQSVLLRSRRVVYDSTTGNSAVLYSPEDVILYKLQYFAEGKMPKHPRDMLTMLEVRQNSIDLEYISAWASQLGLEAIWNEILDEYHERINKKSK